MTTAQQIAKLIRDALKVKDGHLSHCSCLNGTLSEQWINARAANISLAICGLYDVRPNAVAGEIGAMPVAVDEPPPVRVTLENEEFPKLCTKKKWCADFEGHLGECIPPF